jgi:hypothetical protein
VCVHPGFNGRKLPRAVGEVMAQAVVCAVASAELEALRGVNAADELPRGSGSFDDRCGRACRLHGRVHGFPRKAERSRRVSL